MKQVPFRLEDNLHATFKQAAAPYGGMQSVLVTLCDAFTSHAEDHRARHLDGSLCPLWELIAALATATRNELTAPRPPPRPPAGPQTAPR